MVHELVHHLQAVELERVDVSLEVLHLVKRFNVKDLLLWCWLVWLGSLWRALFNYGFISSVTGSQHRCRIGRGVLLLLLKVKGKLLAFKTNVGWHDSSIVTVGSKVSRHHLFASHELSYL